MKNPLFWLIGLGTLTVIGVAAALYLLRQDLSCPSTTAPEMGLNQEIERSLKSVGMSSRTWMPISSNRASRISVFRLSSAERARVEATIDKKVWLSSGGAPQYRHTREQTVYVSVGKYNLVAVMLREANHAPSAYTVMKVDCFLRNSENYRSRAGNDRYGSPTAGGGCHRGSPLGWPG